MNNKNNNNFKKLLTVLVVGLFFTFSIFLTNKLITAKGNIKQEMWTVDDSGSILGEPPQEWTSNSLYMSDNYSADFQGVTQIPINDAETLMQALNSIYNSTEDSPAFYNCSLYLTNNIDLSGYKLTFPEDVFHNSNFVGSFDGCGYTINGLFVDCPNSPYYGLFGYKSTGTISRVRLDDCYFNVGTSAEQFGMICAINGGTITQTIINNAVVVSNLSTSSKPQTMMKIGGVCALNGAPTSINVNSVDQIYNSGTVSFSYVDARIICGTNSVAGGICYELADGESSNLTENVSRIKISSSCTLTDAKTSLIAVVVGESSTIISCRYTKESMTNFATNEQNAFKAYGTENALTLAQSGTSPIIGDQIDNDFFVYALNDALLKSSLNYWYYYDASSDVPRMSLQETRDCAYYITVNRTVASANDLTRYKTLTPIYIPFPYTDVTVAEGTPELYINVEPLFGYNYSSFKSSLTTEMELTTTASSNENYSENLSFGVFTWSELLNSPTLNLVYTPKNFGINFSIIRDTTVPETVSTVIEATHKLPNTELHDNTSDENVSFASNDSLPYGNSVTFNFTKITGYHSSWYLNDVLVGSDVENYNISVAQTNSLSIVLTPYEYTITYYDVDDTTNYPITHRYGSETELPIPTAEFKSFNSWMNSETGVELSNNVIGAYDIETDVAVVALWTNLEYTFKLTALATTNHSLDLSIIFNGFKVQLPETQVDNPESGEPASITLNEKGEAKLSANSYFAIENAPTSSVAVFNHWELDGETSEEMSNYIGDMFIPTRSYVAYYDIVATDERNELSEEELNSVPFLIINTQGANTFTIDSKYSKNPTCTTLESAVSEAVASLRYENLAQKTLALAERLSLQENYYSSIIGDDIKKITIENGKYIYEGNSYDTLDEIVAVFKLKIAQSKKTEILDTIKTYTRNCNGNAINSKLSGYTSQFSELQVDISDEFVNKIVEEYNLMLQELTSSALRQVYQNKLSELFQTAYNEGIWTSESLEEFKTKIETYISEINGLIVEDEIKAVLNKAKIDYSNLKRKALVQNSDTNEFKLIINTPNGFNNEQNLTVEYNFEIPTALLNEITNAGEEVVGRWKINVSNVSEGLYTVTIELDENVEYLNGLTIIHVKSNGETEKIIPIVNGKTITFQTTGFSPFYLVAKKPLSPWWAVGIIAIIITLATALIIINKKSGANNEIE